MLRRFTYVALACSSFLVTSTRADFGMAFVAESAKGLRLDHPKDELSFRFRANQHAALRAVAIHCTAAKNPPAYLVSLHADQGGKPGKQALGKTSVVPKADTWSMLPLDQDSVSLVEGRDYHLVIRWDALRGGKHPVGVIDENHWAEFTVTSPQNSVYPYDQAPNPSVQVLHNGKASGHQPVFLALNRGQRLFGNPYSLPLSLPIHGNGTPDNPEDDLWQSQALHFHCGSNSNQIKLRLKTKGKPSAPLQLSILKHDYMHHKIRPHFDTTVPVPAAGLPEWTWVAIDLPRDQASSFSPDCHYFGLHTSSGQAADPDSCDDCYLISGASSHSGLPGGPDITFDGAAHQSRAAWSIGGKDWADRFEADLNVIVQARDCPEPNQPLTPIPAPEFPLGGKP